VRSCSWRRRCRLRENVNIGLRSGCLRRRSELSVAQALLQEFNVLHELLELLFVGRGIAAPAPFYDSGIDKRRQAHHQPPEKEQENVSHKLIL
jgi:hypothetical protein